MAPIGLSLFRPPPLGPGCLDDSVLLGIFGAIIFWPVILGKVKTILQNKNRAALLEYIQGSSRVHNCGSVKKYRD